MSSDDLFYATNSPKPKYIEFITIYTREKLQILTFEKLEEANVWYICLKNDWKNESEIKYVVWHCLYFISCSHVYTCNSSSSVDFIQFFSLNSLYHSGPFNSYSFWKSFRVCTKYFLSSTNANNRQDVSFCSSLVIGRNNNNNNNNTKG